MNRVAGVMMLMVFLALSAGGQVNLGDELEINYLKPKKYEIGGITVTGVKYLDNNALVVLSGLSVGDMVEIPGDAITRAIENLWEQGLFENVRITATRVQGNTIFLNIDLSERPRMSYFSFDGIKKAEEL